jgi:UDP-glucose 4-epimerase
MKVLVTGGNGLFGHGVVRSLLDRGVDVVSFDIAPRPWYMDDLAEAMQFVRGDLMHPTDLLRVCKEENVDRIVNMAALQGRPCEENPWACYHLNTMGTVMALEVGRILDLERVVCASSGAAAGHVSGRFDEETEREPISQYGASKLAVEHLVEQYARTHGVNGIALRPARGYGIGPRIGSLPILNLAVPALRGETVKVVDTGRKLELLYYRDCGQAFAMAVLADDTPRHRLFNLGNGGHALSMPEIVEIIKETIPDGEFEFVAGEMGPTATRQSVRAITRIAEEIGWVPEHTPYTGIPKQIAWLKEHYLPRGSQSLGNQPQLLEDFVGRTQEAES